MPLFQSRKNKLTAVKELQIGLEKDLQRLTETSLEEVFGLRFIATEFALQNFRIDTLAYDEETCSFVIIEYKKDKSFSVIDQGFSYLSLLLNNKAEFVLAFNEKKNKSLSKDDVDWKQSRVLFLAQSFTPYQLNAIGFKDLPIELWEVKKYENELILFSQVKPLNKTESIKTISKDTKIQKVSSEVRPYTIEDQFKEGWDISRELYSEFWNELSMLDNRIEETPRRAGVSLKVGTKVLAYVHIYKSKIRVDITRTTPKDLNDPEKRVKYIENSRKFYNQDISFFEVKASEDIGYAIMLLKQALKKY